MEILGHIGQGDGLDMGAGDHTGGQGGHTAQREAIEQCGLACQDDGEQGTGVVAVLGDDMQFGKDLGSEVAGLIENQHGADLSVLHQVHHRSPDGPGEPGTAVGVDLQVQGPGDLPVEFGDGPGGRGAGTPLSDLAVRTRVCRRVIEIGDSFCLALTINSILW